MNLSNINKSLNNLFYNEQKQHVPYFIYTVYRPILKNCPNKLQGG